MKKIFFLLFVLPMLFSCGDGNDNEGGKDKSVEIFDFDDQLFCECLQYEIDLINAVLDGPFDAIRNESDFELKNIELDKKCESFERKLEKRAKVEEERGEKYLDKMIQSIENQQKECACYDQFTEAMNRQKKAIENLLEDNNNQLDHELNDLDGINFRLNISDKRAPPSGRISFIADYKIQLTDGSSIVAVFEDSGEGYISNEKDYVSMRTDAGSERTYKYIKNGNGNIRVILNFFFDGMENEIWRKTYKKNNMNDWIQISCEGDCEH